MCAHAGTGEGVACAEGPRGRAGRAFTQPDPNRSRVAAQVRGRGATFCAWPPTTQSHTCSPAQADQPVPRRDLASPGAASRICS